jgi:hypothetical protein
VQLHSFLTLAVDGGERLTSRSNCFIPGKEPQYPLNMGLGGPQSQEILKVWIYILKLFKILISVSVLFYVLWWLVQVNMVL